MATDAQGKAQGKALQARLSSHATLLSRASSYHLPPTHRTASFHTREQSSSFSAYLPKNSRGTSEWVTRLKKCWCLRCHSKCLADYVFILSPVEIPKREGVTLEKVIAEDSLFRSWGDHLDAWQPLDRTRTLLLRFEDITELSEKAIASMALFLKMENQMEWANAIASLQNLSLD